MSNIYCSSCQNGCGSRSFPSPRSRSFPSPRIAAYTAVLDQASSNLNPGAGETQHFCYQIAPNQAAGQTVLPLDSIVIGIAGSITSGDFDMLTVSINGVNQPVSWGTNTFLVTDDTNTGCTGLRLMFPLNNVTDVMRVCMAMKSVYAVGNIPVCFSDGGQDISSVSVLGPSALQGDECPTTTYQEVDVCVPVTISPFATVGVPVVTCCGDPAITPGTASCGGTVGGSCSFTISQRVCVAVPVAFGANAQVGDYAVCCGTPGSGTCEGCAGNTPAQANSANSGGFVPIGQTYLNDVIQRSTKRCGK